MDLIASYFPLPAELTTAQRQAARTRIAAWLQTKHPDVDLRPNSVAGDHLVTPMADLLAALETAVDRLVSDLTLANVERGVVYNCDVVQKFLENFGVTAQPALPARGYVRLVFETDVDRELDRSIQFSFGADRIFTPMVFDSNQPLVFSLDQTVAINYWRYRWTSTGAEIILPLEGTASATPPTAGERPLLSAEIPGLIAVEAVADFFEGESAPTIPEQALRARLIASQAGFSTKLGAVSALLRRFTDFTAVSTVGPGDIEYLYPAPGHVDVHVRSRTPWIEVREQVRLFYNATADRFYAQWRPASAPLRIVGISQGTRTFDIEDSETRIAAFSVGPRPLFAAGFSGEEQFGIGVPMPRDGSAPLIIPEAYGDDLAAVFEIAYWTDPSVDSVRRFVKDPLNAPAANVRVRPFIPYLVTEMEVSFVRQPGVELQLQTAREELQTLLHSLGGESRWSLAKATTIMVNAGAGSVTRIRFSGRALFSAAKQHVNSGDSLADEGDIDADSVDHPEVTMEATEALDEDLAYLNEGAFCAVGMNNVGFLLEAANIVFREVRK